MPYTSISELTDRFGAALLTQLTDRAEIATGQMDTDVIDQVIEDTDALIDGYVVGRYALPMAETPALLATLARDITIYKLHVYSPDDKIVEDYKSALSTLKAIAAGSVKLPVAGKEAPGSGSSGARLTDRNRDLTQSSMKGYI